MGEHLEYLIENSGIHSYLDYLSEEMRTIYISLGKKELLREEKGINPLMLDILRTDASINPLAIEDPNSIVVLEYDIENRFYVTEASRKGIEGKIYSGIIPVPFNKEESTENFSYSTVGNNIYDMKNEYILNNLIIATAGYLMQFEKIYKPFERTRLSN